PEAERPIGEIVSDLVDEGKAFARAELNLAKAIASAKASGLKAPLILLAAAMFVAMAALNALAVAIFVALDSLMGHFLAGILAFLLIGGVAGLLGWLGYKKIRDLQ
ncbi:MAG: phage holin family protein, partial [Sphingomonas sp.]|nr:phage holin family protein [Sphingomonas sp.]